MRYSARSPEASWHRLSVSERAVRLQTTTMAAVACADWTRVELDRLLGIDPTARASVHLWLDLLDKILNDELTLTRDADGHITQVSALPKDEKGGYGLMV